MRKTNHKNKEDLAPLTLHALNEATSRYLSTFSHNQNTMTRILEKSRNKRLD